MAQTPACEDRKDAISALVSNELPEAQARELLAHMETCEGCRAARKAFTDLDTLMQVRGEDEPEAGDDRWKKGAAQLIERAKRETPGSAPQGTTKTSPLFAILLSLAILGVVVAVLIGSGAIRVYKQPQPFSGEDPDAPRRVTTGAEKSVDVAAKEVDATPEQKTQMKAIEAEYDPRLTAAKSKKDRDFVANEMWSQIRRDVLKTGDQKSKLDAYLTR